ncbi:hypothetical protein [Pelistega ratti]|nr:hypothetical protein [Pelistega ratti]
MMTNSNSPIRYGFYLAGIYNLIGILGFTQFFTNQTLAELDPIVFSIMGQIGIILWGLAYLSVSHQYFTVPKLIAVFCIEKMVYAGAWLYWLLTQTEKLESLPASQLYIDIFFRTYGIGDFLFGIFFGYIAYRGFKQLNQSA